MVCAATSVAEEVASVVVVVAGEQAASRKARMVTSERIVVNILRFMKFSYA
jgi:hypothetical protein